MGDAVHSIDEQICVGGDLVAVVHREQRQLRAAGTQRGPVGELVELLVGGVGDLGPPVADDRRSQRVERHHPYLVRGRLELRVGKIIVTIVSCS